MRRSFDDSNFASQEFRLTPKVLLLPCKCLRKKLWLLPKQSLFSELRMRRVTWNQGHNEGAQFPGRQITGGAPKSPNNVTSTFFNAVGYICFRKTCYRHGGAKLASCPGRHLISLRPFVISISYFFADLEITWNGFPIFMLNNLLTDSTS